MILSFISQKGGSGKTTLSVNLAALAASNGVPVAIVDLDPQASASAWCAARGTDDIRHEACHPPLLARTLERLREADVALIVIDTPPHNSTAAANAIRASDFVAVPVRPSSFDLAAVAETVDLVRHANGRAGAVLNSVPSSTSVSDPAAAFLAQQNLIVLSRVGQRMAFQHAASTGRGGRRDGAQIEGRGRNRRTLERHQEKIVMTKNAPDFAGFATRASQAKKPTVPVARDIDVVRHLQVRLTRNDAVRFKHAAEDRGLTIQSALVEAINRVFAEWGESPAADPTTGQK